jgi:uncharacterized membrane protein
VFVLTVVAATVTLLFTGAVAGVFFAYSVSVMIGLDGIKPEQAIVAMQSINEKIQNPLFLPAFLLAPFAAAATGALLLGLGQRAPGLIFIAAAAVYAAGALLPTIAVNVPMNNALAVAAIPADPQEAARLWADYSSRWTSWNHLRTVASLLGLLLTGLGLFIWGRSAS